MLSEEVRARLAQIAGSQPRPIARDAPRHRPTQQLLRVTSLSPDEPDPAAFDLAAAQVHSASSGKHLRLKRPLADLWPDAKSFLPQAASRFAHAPIAEPRHPELTAVAENFPTATMFLDLETCGFAGAPIFLAGVVWCDGEMLIVDQLFARDYTEERSLLETLGQIAATQRVLATFNGKSFDWPMVCDRSVRHRLRARSAVPLRKHGDCANDALAHCDLLHHARRRWKRVLPNCKLQTLERLVCRRTRHDDLGGAEIPTAYHHYVRTGESAPIEKILLHNALDLVTLVDVTLRLIGSPSEAIRLRPAAG